MVIKYISRIFVKQLTIKKLKIMKKLELTIDWVLNKLSETTMVNDGTFLISNMKDMKSMSVFEYFLFEKALQDLGIEYTYEELIDDDADEKNPDYIYQNWSITESEMEKYKDEIPETYKRYKQQSNNIFNEVTGKYESKPNWTIK